MRLAQRPRHVQLGWLAALAAVAALVLVAPSLAVADRQRALPPVGVVHASAQKVLSSPSAPDAAFNAQPLFARFIFFTPGIFMGLLVSLVLLSIFFYALSYLSAVQSLSRVETPPSSSGAAGKKNL